MDSLDLGTHFKSLTRENLFDSLSHIYSSNNLLVTSRETSKLVNYLAPFSVLKEKGRFEKTLLIDDIISPEEVYPIISVYNSLTIIVSSDMAGVQQLKKLWSFLDNRKHGNLNIVVKNLTKSFYEQIYSEIFHHQTSETFVRYAELDTSASVIRISAHSKILPWKAYPVFIHDNVFSLNMENGGLSEYFDNPLHVVSNLSHSILDILSETTTRRGTIKIKNIFAKGDHSSLLVKNLLEEKLPKFLSSKLSFNEQEFYSNKLSGNADLVVLERNLDYFPVLLSHMNYMGLLDDVFGTEDELNNILSTKEKLDDELFNNIKHLNFGSIGLKLNKLARYIQLELEQSDKLKDLEEIKQLVKNLGSLTSKQDMVRKHTNLSETILRCIKCDKGSDYKFDIREIWFELQNDIFELDYKSQLKRLFFMVEKCVPFEIAMSLTTLISLINDGLRQGDMDAISKSMQLNFGLRGALTLKALLDHNIIKVNTKGNDFFGTFTFGKTEIETTTASTSIATTGGHTRPSEEADYEDIASVGISSGQDVYKSTYTLISKFWNLHPLEEEDIDTSRIESVFDYPQPSFTLPSATVPLTVRIVEALYFRDFLKYKPVNNISKRPNWNNLNIDTMFKGQTIDKNLCDESDNRKATSKGTLGQQYVIVVLLGGITRSEISAFQYLQGKLDRKILIVTTGLVNNKNFWRVMGSE
ncbi:hypothetical protein JCM33374_g5411 [Metschnikowia sp. JCM 33374]|nr:hypothetical protein JCM33374_g5411 [Metschnikowia sp. JCM 33374]